MLTAVGAVARHIKAVDVLEALSVQMISRGVPAYIRSDNGPEFVAIALRQWLAKIGVQPPILNQEVPGRMAIASPATANSEISFSTEKFSTASRKP